MATMKRYGSDSAHSWLLAAASALVSLAVHGTAVGFSGILFVAFIRDNGGTREENSWPFSLSQAMNILAGPMLIPLGSRFSLRAISMSGVILATLGSAACFFSTNIYYVSFFFGVVRGLGVVLLTTLTTVLFNTCFKKYRATAMGVATSIMQLGSILSPHLAKYLLDLYGVRGTLLILGGISLHGALGAAIMVQYGDSHYSKNIKLKPCPGQTNISKLGEKAVVKDVEQKLILDADKEVGRTEVVFKINYVSNGYCTAEEKVSSEFGNVDQKMIVETDSDTVRVSACNKEQNCAEHIQISDQDKETKTRKRECCDTAGIESVFTNPYFYLIVLTRIVMFSSNFFITVIFIDYATDKGISADESIYFLPVFSGCNILGKFSLGWISDKNYVSKSTYMSFSCSIMAVLYFTMSSAYELLMFCVSLSGIIMGNIFPISIILYSEFVPKEYILIAVSIGRSFTGLGIIVTTLILGAFRDNTGSYDNLVRLNGASTMVITCLWLVVSLLQRRYKTSTFRQS